MESQYGYYDPDGDADWFPPNPLDSMPLATNNNRYHPSKEASSWYDTAPSEYEPPMQDSDWFIEKPDESDEIEKEKEITIHEKMYRMATKNGTHTLGGGSENLNSR